MIRADLDQLRAAAEAVARDDRLRLVILFGSGARREPREAEDLDLGVLGFGELDPIDLTNRFTRFLGVQEIDVTDLSRADPLVLVLAARDGIPLHEAEPGAFARFSSLAARRFADTRKFRDAERDAIEDFLDRSVR